MRPTRDEQAFAELLDGLRREAPADVAKFARLAQALESVRPAPSPAPDATPMNCRRLRSTSTSLRAC